jgi:hypothetical protein
MGLERLRRPCRAMPEMRLGLLDREDLSLIRLLSGWR